MPRPLFPWQTPGYTPSPPINRTYIGPDVPVAYQDGWQYFNNLTADQIAWFQAQPEWQNFLSYVALSPQTATVATPVAVVNSVLATVSPPLTSPLALNVSK